jgi:hypothetical protein
MKWFKSIIISLVAVSAAGLVLMPMPVAAADDTTQKNIEEICAANPEASICKDEINNPDPEGGVAKTAQNVISVLLFGIGVMAAVSIIICGIRFASSHGDSSAAQKARTQLVYSVVGLVIAVLAFAIVNFVFARLEGGGGSSGGGGGSGGGGTTPAVTPQNCIDQGKVYVGPDNTTTPPTPAQCI